MIGDREPRLFERSVTFSDRMNSIRGESGVIVGTHAHRALRHLQKPEVLGVH